MNAMSLISWATSCKPLMAVLYLRGRLENVGLPTQRRTISSIAHVGSRTSSSDSPAKGEPSTTRGQSPHASVVCSPTESSRSQIWGTSSIRIQWYWTFSRSLMSAVSRANSVEISPMVRKPAAVSAPPSQRTRIMKYLASRMSAFSSPVHVPS